MHSNPIAGTTCHDEWKRLVEAVARVICDYKRWPCPGSACRECADKARAVLAVLPTTQSRAGEGDIRVDVRNADEIALFLKEWLRVEHKSIEGISYVAVAIADSVDALFTQASRTRPRRETIDTSDEACAVACMLVSNPQGSLRKDGDGWQRRVNDLIRALRDERNELRQAITQSRAAASNPPATGEGEELGRKCPACLGRGFVPGPPTPVKARGITEPNNPDGNCAFCGGSGWITEATNTLPDGAGTGEGERRAKGWQSFAVNAHQICKELREPAGQFGKSAVLCRHAAEAIEQLQAALTAAHHSGVLKGREEAAKVAEHLNGWGSIPSPELAAHIAKVIRSLPPPQEGEVREVWQHKKRGTEYTVVGSAQVQAEEPLTDYEVVTVYRSIANGELWVRRSTEFRERFELVCQAIERSCTCHPDDNPPVPCPRKYALSECRIEAARQIFAAALERHSEPNLAAMVRSGVDNSNGGQAAIEAIQRALTSSRHSGVLEANRQATPEAEQSYLAQRQDWWQRGREEAAALCDQKADAWEASASMTAPDARVCHHKIADALRACAHDIQQTAARSLPPPPPNEADMSERCLCPDFELRGQIYEIWPDSTHPSNRCLVDPCKREVVDTDHAFSPPLSNDELLSIYDYGKGY